MQARGFKRKRRDSKCSWLMLMAADRCTRAHSRAQQAPGDLRPFCTHASGGCTVRCESILAGPRQQLLAMACLFAAPRTD